MQQFAKLYQVKIWSGFDSHTLCMVYYCDNKRHLVCIPYSIGNLHKMAADLGIKRCWFHGDHYDIPKRRVEEITSKCELVSPKDIVRIKIGEFCKDFFEKYSELMSKLANE
jgi:hypothetical protein